jgi:hypothetical protein
MDVTQTTGLMVIHKGKVVAERYQYDRQPGMPLRSFSMAKTFTAVLVGIAQAKGFIKSLDDKAADYWPEIAESAYGQTTVRSLLRMSSGVPFKELYTWTPDDDIWVWSQVLYNPANYNSPARISDYLNSKKIRNAANKQIRREFSQTISHKFCQNKPRIQPKIKHQIQPSIQPKIHRHIQPRIQLRIQLKVSRKFSQKFSQRFSR